VLYGGVSAAPPPPLSAARLQRNHRHGFPLPPTAFPHATACSLQLKATQVASRQPDAPGGQRALADAAVRAAASSWSRLQPQLCPCRDPQQRNHAGLCPGSSVPKTRSAWRSRSGCSSSPCQVPAPPWELGRALLDSAHPSCSPLRQPPKGFQSQSSTSSCTRDLHWRQKRFLYCCYRVLLISSKHPSLPLGAALALQP